jgi:hypothetical protein
MHSAAENVSKLRSNGAQETILAELTPNEYDNSGEACELPHLHRDRRDQRSEGACVAPFDDGSRWNEDGDRKLIFEERTALGSELREFRDGELGWCGNNRESRTCNKTSRLSRSAKRCS